jgi:hypothetical protein
MQPLAHNFTIAQKDGELIAACECGRWRRTLPLSRGMSLPVAVAELAGRHERHLNRLGKATVEASDDDLAVFADNE